MIRYILNHRDTNNRKGHLENARSIASNPSVRIKITEKIHQLAKEGIRDVYHKKEYAMYITFQVLFKVLQYKFKVMFLHIFTDIFYF